MSFQNELLQKLGIKYPIIQAPLGGGPGTPELTAAVSNAGGIGSLAGAYLSTDDLRSSIQKTKSLTNLPFIVNLFAPSPVPTVSEKQIADAMAATKKYRQSLGLPDPQIKLSPFAEFEEQMKIVYEEKPRAFSFTFGSIERKYIEQCQRLEILTIGTATTFEEALQLESDGVDAICLQGYEAGGHRGNFSVDAEDSKIQLRELLQLCVSKIKSPLIAAGGLMSGQDIQGVLSAGAAAAQLGTAFMLCPETGTSKPYREALLRENSKTRLTRAFSGRLARGIENRFLVEMENAEILPWPTQNAFTRDMRNKSAELGSSEYLSLWAGTGFSSIRQMPAGELVATLVREMKS